jgi:hypothetical protein
MFMSLRDTILGVSAVLLAGAIAVAGEEESSVKGPAPGQQEPIQVKAPFEKLFTGRRHQDRANAIRELLPRASELAEAARGEAARLRGLQPPKDGSVARSAFDFAVRALDGLAAEPEAMKPWKPGLSAATQKVAGKTVTMDCADRPLSEVLAKAAAGWGVPIEMSPAAAQVAGALDVTLEGSPTLTEFLDWLCAEQGLIRGCSGEKIVLVLLESVKLQERMEKAAARGP